MTQEERAAPAYRSRRVLLPAIAFVVGAIATIVVVATTTGVFDSHAPSSTQDTSSGTEAPSSFTAVGDNTTALDVTTTAPKATPSGTGGASHLGATSTSVDPTAPGETMSHNTESSTPTSELASGSDSMWASASSSAAGSEHWDSSTSAAGNESWDNSASSSSAPFDWDEIEPPASAESGSNSTMPASAHTNDGNAAAVQERAIQAKLSQHLNRLRAEQKQLQRQIQLAQRQTPTSVSGLHTSIASTTVYNQQLQAQLAALAASRQHPK
ncbi:hypothetical protein SPRG_17436 [Saprolegnia parasitica CBS 223.65]|uniref:Uncharacterized protein n=1 Tax=Saprolegnia parasitica (strain CBS 223.65) TaxID=695850 RepID=A0A067BGC4_SAPPC|nr:hypothetical protein SPRG_17436 [Saprolegnia parasitica CBS 223.65]KDO17168.1 hypothetical protein SPRG_17436 [Saprolegnia parasitica CBS 223.65]|eukprot:XP_012212123.1 hypothetical protein SPRG_17436 [Saprolegnia parasitica CBS 223.65]